MRSCRGSLCSNDGKELRAESGCAVWGVRSVAHGHGHETPKRRKGRVNRCDGDIILGAIYDNVMTVKHRRIILFLFSSLPTFWRIIIGIILGLLRRLYHSSQVLISISAAFSCGPDQNIACQRLITLNSSMCSSCISQS